MTYGHASLGWTTSAHRCEKYTETVIFRVFLVFVLPVTYVEQKATQQCRMNLYAHVSWTHETELRTFWIIQTFLSGKLCFLWITCICTKVDHLESLVGFRSILHRALNNNEMVLIFVCFAFLMCTHRNEEITLHCSKQSSAHSVRWPWKLRYLLIMRDFA